MRLDRMRGLAVLLLCALIAWLCVADASVADDAATADEKASAGEAAAAVADAEAVDPTAVRLKLPETAAEPGSAEARRQMRFDRIVAALREPPHHASRSEIRSRLAALIRDTSDLTLLTTDRRDRLDAYALHMQALHAYITIFPQDPRVESYLARLGNTAAQAKQIDDAEAAAIADFWQLTVDLVQINRSGASIDEQRHRMLPLLIAYYELHAGHPAAYAVGQMIEELREDAGPVSRQQTEVTETPAASPRGERQEEQVQPGFVVPFDFDQAPVE